MKTVVAALVLLASVTFASPAENSYHYRSADSIKDEPLLVVDSMFFTGPVTVGGPNVTLQGTAKSIYEQVLKLNPAYDPWEFPGYSARMAARGFTKENMDQTLADPLSERDIVARQSNIDCGRGNYVGNYFTQCYEGLDYLRRLGTAACGARANSCARVSCSTNCGMFLCNTGGNHLDVWCGDIQRDMNDITGKCKQSIGGQITRSRGRMTFGRHYTELSQVSC